MNFKRKGCIKLYRPFRPFRPFEYLSCCYIYSYKMDGLDG